MIDGACRIHDVKTEYDILIRKSKGKNLLQRCRHSWENNIKMGFKVGRCDITDWIGFDFGLYKIRETF
jgi:hypothetical protein